MNGTLNADATPAAPISAVADGDWPAYGRNREGQRYSPLKQINADNVKNLKEALGIPHRRPEAAQRSG